MLRLISKPSLTQKIVECEISVKASTLRSGGVHSSGEKKIPLSAHLKSQL